MYAIRSYYVIDGIHALDKPVYWLPGNHDDSQVMANVMEQQGISPVKLLVSDHWLLVLLDTQVEGRPGGHVSPAQFAFLRQALDAFRNNFV